jgi:hypothetical protein
MNEISGFSEVYVFTCRYCGLGVGLWPLSPHRSLLPDDQLVHRQLADAELIDSALPNYDSPDRECANC